MFLFCEEVLTSYIGGDRVMYHNATINHKSHGPLVALCGDPWRYMNKQALFYIDYVTDRYIHSDAIQYKIS